MANIQNVRIGPASLTWKTQDLGNTLGGVKLSFDRNFTNLKVDKYGDTPVDAALTGTMIKITVKIAEPVVSMIQRVLPEGAFNTGALGSQVGLAAGEGLLMRQFAGLLVLHPTSKAPSDFSEDVSIYQAFPSSSPTDLNYEVNNQRVYSLEFTALVDESYTAGKRLGHIGPTSVS